MFERLTDEARQVVVHAQEEARRLDHDHVGTEHLLLGMLHEDTGTAAEALADAGMRLDPVRDAVREIAGGGRPSGTEHIAFSTRAKKALEYSLRESLQLGHDYIGSEHILLGLLREGEGAGAQALTRLGADLDDIRRRVLRLLREHPAGAGTGRRPTGLAVLEDRLAKIEKRLDRIEGLLRDGSGHDSP